MWSEMDGDLGTSMRNGAAAMGELRRKYPWPAARPRREPNDFGWCSRSNKRVLRRNLGRRTRLVVEIGSFMGLSARWIVRKAANATLVCVDGWWKSDEQTVRRFGIPPVSLEREGSYETFLVNLWSYRDRVIPMRAKSHDALPELAAMGLKPDLFYVDGSHEYEDVARDLELIETHFPNTRVVGDDYMRCWPGVVRAVHEFCATHDYLLKLDKGSWSIQK